MSKQAVFTMKLDPELRAEFMAEAEAAHRPASQVLRELMREFIQSQRKSREYDEFLRRKVEPAGLQCALDWGDRTMKLRPNSPHGVPVWRASRELFGRPKRSKTVPMCGTTSQPTIRAAARMDEIFSDAAARLIQHPCWAKPERFPGPAS